jgi:hypothetical protein
LTEVVIDASVALAWCFPDEASDYADGVLVALPSWPVSEVNVCASRKSGVS